MSTVTVSGGGQGSIEELSSSFGDAGQELSLFSGHVTDSFEKPLTDVSVLLCGSACWMARTETDGTFRFTDVPPEQYKLEVRGHLVSSRDLSTVLFPIQIVAGEQKLLTPIRLLDIVSKPLVDATEGVNIEGLNLKLESMTDLAVLEQASKEENNPEIGAALVPSSDWPDYSLQSAGRTYSPVTMWALSPFGVDLGIPWSAQVDFQEEIHPGDKTFAFFSVDHITGEAKWLSHAMLNGNKFCTLEGHGIQIFTWLILAVQI